MPLSEFALFAIAAWGSFVEFVNSTFISAFLSALAGAGFGVWGAQKLAERTMRTRELLEALRQANAIVVLATTITNQALSIKKQHVKPLADRYFADREVVKLTNDRLLSGQPANPITFQAELTKISPLTLPIDSLKNFTFTAQLMPGRALALVSMVEQSVTELARSIAIRSEMIDVFHRAGLPHHIFCQDYYGLKRQDGNINSMYHDSMVAINQYTNDVAFFSAELAQDLQAHALRVRKKLLKLRRDVPKATSVDFSGPEASRLLPSREDYASWLSGFKSQD